MPERPTPGEGQPQLSPQQRAEQLFERRVTAPNYSGDAIQKALDRVRASGLRNKLGNSPAEVYAKLAQMSAQAKERATEQGASEDVQRFAEQESQFNQVGEMLSGIPVESQTPSRVKRIAGLASG